MPLSRDDRPRHARKARLVRDPVTGREVLLAPERGLALNETAARVIARLDGTRTLGEIAAEIAGELAGVGPGEALRDVIALVEALGARALLDAMDGIHIDPSAGSGARGGLEEGRPYTLIAELTYRCPLRCPYCSNPTALAGDARELSTAEWERVLGEAAGLGVMQVHLTGGEPLARKDLEAIARRARALGLYTSLITSGVPLARGRLAALREAGVDHVQLSVQDAEAEGADRIAGRAAFGHKLEVAAWVKAEGLPLTVNVVLHRANIDHVPAIVALAERLGADRLELANAQYLGWALANREALLPAREQIERAFAAAGEARARLAGRMEIAHVTPDYHADRPRACMEGWARRYVHVEPSGLVLPCHAAHTLPGLAFDSVRDRPLAWIWSESPALNRFRGEAWMREPCQSCDRRAIDFGGCRCQAHHLAGDAADADPACALAPAHGIVTEARLRASSRDVRRSLPREMPRYLYRERPRRSV